MIKGNPNINISRMHHWQYIWLDILPHSLFINTVMWLLLKDIPVARVTFYTGPYMNKAVFMSANFYSLDVSRDVSFVGQWLWKIVKSSSRKIINLSQSTSHRVSFMWAFSLVWSKERENWWNTNTNLYQISADLDWPQNSLLS